MSNKVKVICTRPNASEEINGVKFEKHPDGIGMVSEPIDADTAQHFLSIEGYELVGAKKEAQTDSGKGSGSDGAGSSTTQAPANTAKATGKGGNKGHKDKPAGDNAGQQQAPAGGGEMTPSTGNANAETGGGSDNKGAEGAGTPGGTPEVF
jgi:hypothetical protein